MKSHFNRTGLTHRKSPELTKSSEASVRFNVIDWDYSQQYPNKGGESRIEAGIEEKSKAEAVYRSESIEGDHTPMEPVFHYDVAASGRLTASVYASHPFLTITPWRGKEI